MPEMLEPVTAAIDYIEAHLTEKLDVDRVAAAVHYSKYHLHRLFTNAVGLTMHEYLQRRRLTEAAKLLVFSNQPILDIALTAGYESQQAFTAVFTAMYKMPPSRFRANENFYPLQLRFHFDKGCRPPKEDGAARWKITYAAEEDIPVWMALVRLVIDGFPNLQEEEYLSVLQERIRTGEALLVKDGRAAVGLLLFSREAGSIDFMGSHPLYRNKGISRLLLEQALKEIRCAKEISITTYREGDRADTGHREEIKRLGFAEAELLVEYGYPTQRFVLPVGTRYEG